MSNEEEKKEKVPEAGEQPAESPVAPGAAELAVPSPRRRVATHLQSFSEMAGHLARELLGPVEVSSATILKALLWGGIGMGGAALIWGSQLYFLREATMTPKAVLLFGFLGALAGFLAGNSRARNCPLCGRSMGTAQNISLTPERASKKEHQLELRIRTTDTGWQGFEPYYLCKHCDREFRPAELIGDGKRDVPREIPSQPLTDAQLHQGLKSPKGSQPSPISKKPQKLKSSNRTKRRR